MTTQISSDPELAPDPSLARIAQLAAVPDADRWARECAWVPGTGYCRKRPCSSKCVFRDQRMCEAERVINARRKRRPSQQTGAERPAPTSTALFVLRGLLRGVLA
jgi:hypothetical protein